MSAHRLDRAVDPEIAFERLFGNARNAFWLDRTQSVSYLGGADEWVREPTLDQQPHDVPLAFTGGYVGYYAYEMKSALGSPNRHTAPVPASAWIPARRFLAIDHVNNATYVVGDWEVDLDGIPDAQRIVPARAEADLAKVESALTVSRADYVADVIRCQEHLQSGDSYEICLTNRATAAATETGFEFYRRLRRINPAPEAAYLRFGDIEIACSSPERFLRIDSAGRVETRPIKGTVPRGDTPEQDEALRSRLLTDPKIAAENLIIVDLLRNDLGRVCTPGSVTVPELMVTETYPTVHQLVSTIHGRLAPGRTALDCVRACFPGGSMTGAPKLRTMEIIDTLEPCARGVYSGTIGYLGHDGSADLNIVIRTAVFANGSMHVGAGGAIVLDSDPNAEFDEVVLKAAAVLRVDRRFSTDSPGNHNNWLPWKLGTERIGR